MHRPDRAVPPRQTLASLSARRPDRGAPPGLDWRAWSFLEWLRVVGWPKLADSSVAQARADLRQLLSITSLWHPVCRVGDANVAGRDAGVPVRVYVPFTGREPRPLLVWFHGGGFVLGDLTIADPTCRALANRSGAVVVSVDYRLAPEHSILDGIDDAYAAAQWAMRHAAALGCDPSRVAVGGESAGATLAALVAQCCRDNGDPMPALQVLVYPCTDCTMALCDPHPPTAQLLTWEGCDWFAGHCFVNVDRADPRVSPYRAADHSRLPRALVITAGCDLLCLDGEAYARRLRQAGVHVDLKRYEGQIHGFFMMDMIFPAARRAQRRVASALAAMPTGRNAAAGETATATTPSIAWAGPEQRAVSAWKELWSRLPPLVAVRVGRSLLESKLRRLRQRWLPSN